MFKLKEHKSSFWQGFVWAWQGFVWTFKNEINFQIQLIVAFLTVVAGIYYQIKAMDWLIVLTMIGLVLAGELFNTAIEILADHQFQVIHPSAKVIKDAAAAAVLIISITALLVGLVVFIPYL